MLDNLSAIVSSEYFKPYEFCPGSSQIRSDIVTLSSIGGWIGIGPVDVKRYFSVGDLSVMLGSVFGAIRPKGNLNYSHLVMSPSQSALRAMGFDEKLFKSGDDFRLPLGFYVIGSGRECDFKLEIKQEGLDRMHLPERGLNLNSANQILRSWYKELAENLPRVLPHHY